jgi:phage terminase large subunit-like protein
MPNILATPPNFPLDRYLAKLRHSGMAHSAYRREVCRTSPILFALVYFPHHLRSSATGGVTSLSEFHVAAGMAAKGWMRTDFGPNESRTGWISSRDSGKSTWFFLILPLWALAYGHRTFVLAFSYTGPMAKRHMMSLGQELANNKRLRADFPQLCRPAMDSRKTVMNTQEGYLAESGAAVVVAGLDQGTLGIKVENRRPDLILVDDGEPPEGDYSDREKEKRLKILTVAILPMNTNAVVNLVGTTTRLNSIMDDVRTGKQWAREENFTCRHFPALVQDEETGEERSSWAHRWPLPYLQSIRHTRSFALNYQCMPTSANGTHWTPDDFVYDTKGRLSALVDVKVLSIDPAVTSGAQSDQTGLAVVGWSGGMRKCLTERARGVRMDPAALRALVHRTLRGDPTIRTVVVEVNNGGDWITQALSPLPGGVKLEVLRSSQNKLARITALYDRYQRGQVVHAKPLQALESQMLAHPTDHDDLIDAVDMGVRWLMAKYAPEPARI